MLLKLASLALIATLATAVPTNWVKATLAETEAEIAARMAIGKTSTNSSEQVHEMRPSIMPIPPSSGCALTSRVFTNAASNFGNEFLSGLSTLNPTTITDIESGATAACNTVWSIATMVNPLGVYMLNLINEVDRTCPLIARALNGNIPAVQLGVTLDASIHVARVGGEVGIAVDMRGNKYCYMGSCGGIGMAPAVQGTIGYALTVVPDVGNIPGSVYYLTGGGDTGPAITAATGIPVQIGFDLTVLYSTQGTFWRCVPTQGFDASLCPLKGVGIGISASAGFDMSIVDIGGGECTTPTCFERIRGTQCGSPVIGPPPRSFHDATNEELYEMSVAPPINTTLLPPEFYQLAAQKRREAVMAKAQAKAVMTNAAMPKAA